MSETVFGCPLQESDPSVDPAAEELRHRGRSEDRLQQDDSRADRGWTQAQVLLHQASMSSKQ